MGIKENEEVEIEVRKAVELRQLFGKFRFKDLQLLKGELREGWQ